MKSLVDKGLRKFSFSLAVLSVLSLFRILNLIGENSFANVLEYLLITFGGANVLEHGLSKIQQLNKNDG